MFFFFHFDLTKWIFNHNLSTNLWVFDKAEVIVNIHLDVFWFGAANRGYNDYQSLLTLELLNGPNLDVTMMTLLQNFFYLLNL